jgi:hypothetical protein
MRSLKGKVAAIIFSAAIWSSAAFGGEETAIPPRPTSVEAVHISDPIRIDGVLSESVWHRQGLSAFLQRDPDEGKPATERTEVWVAYDNEAIYVAARMFDSAPDSIVRRLVRRDASINSDDVAVFLDPYHDRRSGFYFGINAAGTLYDGILYNDDWDDDTWDGVWEGKTSIDEHGWTAEFRIPYSQLRFMAQDHQVWGFNFEREISRKNERDFLVYTPKNGSGFVSRFINLVGIENIDPPSRLEILPYLSTKADFTGHPDGDPFHGNAQYTPNLGADVKFGIGSNITINGTINPDFGQVEVDPAVVNLSDVETYFTEKRPFFVEGSTIFDFGYGGANSNWGFNWGGPTFFYSRRIGRAPEGQLPGNTNYSDIPAGTSILGAAKLTGKLGDSWNVGSINAVTAKEVARVDTAGRRFDMTVEPLTYYGVFRGQKEFDAGREGLGFISTVTKRRFDGPYLRDQLNSGSLVMGIDGWTFLDSSKVWVINGWTGTSYVSGNTARMLSLQTSSAHYLQRPDAGHVHVDSGATHLQGFAGRIALNKQKGDFYVNAAFGFIDPNFEVDDLGYMWRTDLVNGHLVLGYRWNEPNSVTRRVSLNVSAFRSYDFGKNLIWAGYWTNGYVQFLSYHYIDWFFAYNPESWSNRRTRGGPLTLNPHGYEVGGDIGTDDRSDWVFSVSTDINHYAQGVDHGVYLSTSLQYKPGANVSFTFSPAMTWYRTSAQWVTSVDDPTATATFGRRYIFADLDQRELSAGVRLDWTFTPRLSLQMYVQPLISVGGYTGLKELALPRSFDFTVYGSGPSTITRSGGSYVIDPDGPGPAPSFSTGDPDFNFKSLRGSAVLRWEYSPGSTLYLVWTQQRVDQSFPGEFQFGKDMSRLFRSRPDNIFLIKISYWINPS